VGRAEPRDPDPVDQLADAHRDVRVRSGPADQLRKLADQAIDGPRGVPGAPPREREGDSADIRRGGRLAAAQRRQDTVKEGVDICNAVPGKVSCQPVFRGL